MRKLENDIKALVEANVITPETAKKITTYYNTTKADKPNRLFTVFGVLGALLVGLGIILILAHNWDNFSKSVKTIIAFVPLVIGQLIVGYSLLKRKSATWKEASGTFLFFAVGSCIALISQIYNIPGNLSNYLLTWILLTVPLLYILRSNMLGILHLVFTSYYASEYGYFSSNKTPWLYLVLLLAFLPFYFQKLKTDRDANSTSVFNWLLPLSVTICLGTFISKSTYFGFLMYVLFFALLYNLGRLPMFYNYRLRQNGYLIIGSIGTIVTLLFITFRWFWKELPKESNMSSQAFYISIVLFIATLTIFIKLNKENGFKQTNIFQYVFLVAVIIFTIGFSNDIIPTVLSNILVFVLGLSAVKIGADKFHFGILNYGLLIITALIVCRFFDTNMSFVVRGLLFVAVGIGFFVTNYIMLKKQREINTNSSH